MCVCVCVCIYGECIKTEEPKTYGIIITANSTRVSPSPS